MSEQQNERNTNKTKKQNFNIIPNHFDINTIVEAQKKVENERMYRNEDINSITSNVSNTKTDSEKSLSVVSKGGDCLKFIDEVKKDMCDYLLKLSDSDLENVIYDYDNTSDENGKDFNKATYIKQVKIFLKKIKKNNYKIIQNYNYSKTLQNKGRIFVKGFGVQSLQYKLRGALLNGINKDYDMINAHPTILLYLCKTYINDNEFLYLKKYVEDRYEVLDTHDLEKNDFLVSINSDKPIKTNNRFLKAFDDEMKIIQKKIYEINPFKIQTNNRRNIKGSILNMTLCIVENEILQQCIAFCKENDIIVQSPMFDGMTIKSDKDLIEVFDTISAQYGIKWKIKDHDDSIVIDYDLIMNNETGYEYLKQELEKTWFYLKSHNKFCEEYTNIDGDIELIMRKKDDFKDLTAKYKIDDKEHIVNQWLEDDDKRSYDKLEFLPPPQKIGDNIYNLYTGLKGDKLTGNDAPYDLILNHIKILTGYDEAGYIYVLNYLAHLIQKAGELPMVALLFRSEAEGVGKDLFFDRFQKYFINDEYCLSTCKIKQVIGQFPLIAKKLLVRINEVSGRDTFTANEDIKDLITAETVNVEKKGIDAIKYRNFGRYIFFSNNQTPISIGTKDRRFVVFDCCNDFANNKDGYADKLLTQLDNQDSMYSFYQYLKNLDISEYRPQYERPITAFYRELQSVNIPPLARFLQYKFDKDTISENIKYQASSLFDKYKAYLTRFHNNNNINITKFGRDIAKYDGVVKNRTKKYLMYNINKTKLIEYLKSNNYYEYIPEADSACDIEGDESEDDIEL